jgi:hypothetical protein
MLPYINVYYVHDCSALGWELGSQVADPSVQLLQWVAMRGFVGVGGCCMRLQSLLDFLLYIVPGMSGAQGLYHSWCFCMF